MTEAGIHPYRLINYSIIILFYFLILWVIFWGDYLFTKVLYALEFGLEAGIMNSQPGEPGGTPAKNA